MSTVEFTPLVATLVFILACIAGHQFRRTWKAEGPRWRLWLWGVISAAGLMSLGFIPLSQTI